MSSISLLAVAGCFDRESIFFINPDGSGKVTIVFQKWDPVANKPENLKRDALHELDRVIEKSTGIETWSDITIGRGKNDGDRWKATAYFPDINKISFSDDALDHIALTKDAKGQLVLTFTPKWALTPTTPITNADEVTKKMLEIRNDARKPLFRNTWSDMRNSVEFVLPASAKEIDGFENVDKSRVRTEFSGKKFVDAYLALIADDERLENWVRTGKPDYDYFNEKMYGVKTLLFSVRFAANAKPQFDYESEARKARKAFPKRLRELEKEAQTQPASQPASGPASKPSK